MAKEKLFRLSRVKASFPDKSSQNDIALYPNDNRNGFHLLMEAQHYWSRMDKFRRERERNKRYCYGEQWGDVIETENGPMTEERYILSQGNIPLKTNLVRRLVRNVVGVYRNQDTEPVCTARDRDEQQLSDTMTTVLQYCNQLNRMKELNGRSIEEFLISGLVVHRKSYGWRNDRLDCWTDIVSPANFFIDNNMRDCRGWDCTFIGEFHDLSFGQLCEQFASSSAEYERLKNIYNYAQDKERLANYAEEFGFNQNRVNDFLVANEIGRCRVIEIWRKESKARYRCHDYNTGEVYKIEIEDYDTEVRAKNAERVSNALAFGIPIEEVPIIDATWFMDDHWHYYYLSPFGHILREGETPYAHKSHPYVFKAYPFIDGEIHSFVGDVIDQQRYVNRLVTLYDWIMRASAKGVLMFPEDAKPDGMSMEDIADEWSRFNGMIIYKAKPGVEPPRQVANNCTNIGINELLTLQLSLMEDISGVNGSLQGKAEYAGMSAAMFNQQTQNATTGLADLLQAFDSFETEGAIKTVKNIQQFYEDKKVFNIAGKTGRIKEYDPEKMQDIEFNLAITQSASNPAFRHIANDMLMQLWQAQAISVEQLLENADLPFADNLLQSIRMQREKVANGEMPEPLPREEINLAKGQASSYAVAQAKKTLMP